MWCPGIPGAGKTFLSSLVVQHLRGVSEDRNIGVFVLYCSFNDPQAQSVEVLLADILKQAAQARDEIVPTLQRMYQLHSKSQTRPTRDELLSRIEIAFAHYKKIYLIVDGLDEILQWHVRLTLIETLCSVKGDVNMMITSRPLPTVQQHFRGDNITFDICNVEYLKSYYHYLDCPDWDSCMQCHASGKAVCVEGHRLIRQFKAFCIQIRAAVEDLQSYVRMRIGQSYSLGSMLSKKPGLQTEIVDAVTRLAVDR